MHTPVMVSEVVEFLNPAVGHRIIDATVGLGGHSAALLEHIVPGGRLLGLDQDPDALDEAERRLEPWQGKFRLERGNFRDLADIVADTGFGPANGVVFDIGTSGLQLGTAGRGFSFAAEGRLDMRMDPEQSLTAGALIARSSAKELERVLREYGEERYARAIARAMKQEGRRLRSTGDLALLVERVVPRRERRIHPATRVFQALRIAVNDELGAIEQALDSLSSWLVPGGRAVVISFHSLEDRVVKQTFRALASRGEATILTRKPLRAAPDEVRANRRSRSARLRAVERTAG
ncbi:16S rRNA (cytosine(1402)-N(4))-methyltransferase RsmH [bacterium]|nr:16S rRNA (cytosine(1402)-N(4))-methyltransferase RsmH [bacterium]